jgi:hypothetical protein
MSRIGSFLVVLLVLAGLSGAAVPAVQAQQNPPDGKDWVSLFDGQSLDGWRASENEETFSVQDGRIVADGPRSHLFYVGSVENHDFDDFEFRVDVMTRPGANSGIYFHTAYQDEGWPSAGYEVQINNSYDSDPRRTGSLYAVDDVKQSPVTDDEWFTMGIRVEGRDVTVTIDGETVVDYTEPADVEREDMAGRVLSSGTLALQGHDPESTVYFKNLYVRPLE